MYIFNSCKATTNMDIINNFKESKESEESVFNNIIILDNIAENYRIVLLLGDQLTDFISTKEAYVFHSDRKKLAKKYSDMWGSKWFMITNPTYGRWELSIYDEMPKSEDEAIQKRKETLNP